MTWRKQRPLVTSPGHQVPVGEATPGPRHWRLIRWALLRAFWVIALAGAALAWWHAQSDTDSAFAQLTRFTTATAARSAFNQPGSLRVDVVFTARPGGRTVQATIAPQNLNSAIRGQRLPIRYDPADPARAAYNGPGGDASLSSSDGGYVAAALLLALAAAIGGSGALRFRRVARAAADAQAESEAWATQTITKWVGLEVRRGSIRRPLAG